MLTPIDLQAAEKKMFPAFRPIFAHIRSAYIQPGESIYAAACCTHMVEYRQDFGKESLRMSHTPSIVVITGHRWIRSGLRMGTPPRKEVVYEKSGSSLGSLFGGDYLEWKWIQVTIEPEVFKKVYANLADNIFMKETRLSNLHIINRLDYSVDFMDAPLKLTEISFGPPKSWVTFEESDGRQVYAALQEADKNKGVIPDAPANVPAPASDPVEALKKLQALLQNGLISQAEYDQKKQEILARL